MALKNTQPKNNKRLYLKKTVTYNNPTKNSPLKKKVTLLNKLKNINSQTVSQIIKDYEPENMEKFLIEICDNIFTDDNFKKILENVFSIIEVYNYLHFVYDINSGLFLSDDELKISGPFHDCFMKKMLYEIKNSMLGSTSNTKMNLNSLLVLFTEIVVIQNVLDVKKFVKMLGKIYEKSDSSVFIDHLEYLSFVFEELSQNNDNIQINLNYFKNDSNIKNEKIYNIKNDFNCINDTNIIAFNQPERSEHGVSNNNINENVNCTNNLKINGTNNQNSNSINNFNENVNSISTRNIKINNTSIKNISFNGNSNCIDDKKFNNNGNNEIIRKNIKSIDNSNDDGIVTNQKDHHKNNDDVDITNIKENFKPSILLNDDELDILKTFILSSISPELIDNNYERVKLILSRLKTDFELENNKKEFKKVIEEEFEEFSFYKNNVSKTDTGVIIENSFKFITENIKDRIKIDENMDNLVKSLYFENKDDKSLFKLTLKLANADNNSIPILSKILVQFKDLHPKFTKKIEEENPKLIFVLFLCEISKFGKYPKKKVIKKLDDLLKNKKHELILTALESVTRFYLCDEESNYEMRKFLEKIKNYRNECTNNVKTDINLVLSRILKRKPTIKSFDDFFSHILSSEIIKSSNIAYILNTEISMILCLKPWIFKTHEFLINLIIEQQIFDKILKVTFENIIITAIENLKYNCIEYTRFYSTLLNRKLEIENVKRIEKLEKKDVKINRNRNNTMEKHYKKNITTNNIESKNIEKGFVFNDGEAKNGYKYENKDSRKNVENYIEKIEKFVKVIKELLIATTTKAYILMNFLDNISNKEIQKLYFETLQNLVSCSEDCNLKIAFGNFTMVHGLNDINFDIENEMEMLSLN